MPITNYEAALISVMSSHRATKYISCLQGNTLSKHHERAQYLEKQGWITLPTSEELTINEQGYFGVAYYRENDDETIEVAFGHRGTCFGFDADGIGNILADIEIAQQKSPKILSSAIKYILDSLNNLSKNMGREISRITNTGFSLGGYIASAVTAKVHKNCNQDTSNKYYAISFDGPGIGPIVLDMDTVDLARLTPHIANYLATPNLVNTCNKQIGLIRGIAKVFNKHPKSNVEFKIEFSNLGFAPIKNLPTEHSIDDFSRQLEKYKDQKNRTSSCNTAMAELMTTANSHNLEAVIKYMESNNNKVTCCNVEQWPAATNLFIYGKDPLAFQQFYAINTGNWLGNIVLNTAGIVLQTAKATIASTLWEITKYSNNEGEWLGIIGIEHKRSNNVIYPVIQSVSTAQLITQRNDNIFNSNDRNNAAIVHESKIEQISSNQQPATPGLR